MDNKVQSTDTEQITLFLISYIFLIKLPFYEETNILIHRQKEKQSLRTNLCPPVQCARLFFSDAVTIANACSALQE